MSPHPNHPHPIIRPTEPIPNNQTDEIEQVPTAASPTRKLLPPDKTTFYQTYGSQFTDDWPDDPPTSQEVSECNDTDWQIQEDDFNIQELISNGVLAPSAAGDRNQRLKNIKWTVTQVDQLPQEYPKLATDPTLSPINFYDRRSSDSRIDTKGPECSQESKQSLENAKFCPLRRYDEVPKVQNTGDPILHKGLDSSRSSTVRRTTDTNTIASTESDKDLHRTPTVKHNITIGVELEIIINDSLPRTMTELFESVAQILTPLSNKLNKVVLTDDFSLGKQERHQAFQVHGDLSIRTEADDILIQEMERWYNKSQRTAKGVEIATPILEDSQWEWVIPEMARVISESFDVMFNASTGLHVHVGIGRDYRLQDLRRISKAIILFEDHMNKYHPKCRNPVIRETNSHILACRGNISLEGLSNLEMMQKLDRAEDTNHLFGMIQPVVTLALYSPMPYYRGYRYNLTSVNRYNTVEFRQAIGTADGEKIVDWINRTIKFVTSAIATPDEIFNNWGEHGISDPAIYHQFGVPPPL